MKIVILALSLIVAAYAANVKVGSGAKEGFDLSFGASGGGNAKRKIASAMDKASEFGKNMYQKGTQAMGSVAEKFKGMAGGISQNGYGGKSGGGYGGDGGGGYGGYATNVKVGSGAKGGFDLSFGASGGGNAKRKIASAMGKASEFGKNMYQKGTQAMGSIAEKFKGMAGGSSQNGYGGKSGGGYGGNGGKSGGGSGGKTGGGYGGGSEGGNGGKSGGGSGGKSGGGQGGFGGKGGFGVAISRDFKFGKGF